MITQKDKSKLNIGANCRSFLAKVVFGMPNNRCLFHGICRLDIVEDFNTILPSNQAYAILFKETNKTLKVCFIMASMDRITIKKHFSEKQFLIVEKKTISIRYQKLLRVKTILQGIYPVTVTEGFLKITVSIQPKASQSKDEMVLI